MDEKLKISVVIPVYNAERYILACVDSLLQQTIDSYEVILVDDCSTDHSAALCLEHYGHESRIRLLQSKENQGAALARNVGLEQARGKYIAFVDADDEVEPDYLEHLYNAAEKVNADVVVEGAVSWQVDEAGNRSGIESHPTTESFCVIPDDITERIKMMFDHVIPMVPWGRIFRRDFLESRQIVYRQVPFFDDVLFNFLALCYARVYVFSPGARYHYRITPTSVTRGNELEKVDRFMEAILLNLQYINEYTQQMPVFVQKPYLKTMVQLYFFNVSFHLQLQPLFVKYSMEEVNAKLEPVLRRFFRENADYVLLMINKCVTQAQMIASSKQEEE